ncbi:hypothetical protein [Desulfobacula sp.]|uniref:hypothetical protein n=1 Tax=Desulfobacula sp. TaxID=2593537 RepID=UPI002603EDEC|nr:hypothetical protein [Desulfobacula sp.]
MIAIYIVFVLIVLIALVFTKKIRELKKGRHLAEDQVSAHDSSDWCIDQFKQTFGNAYVAVKVGKKIMI